MQIPGMKEMKWKTKKSGYTFIKSDIKTAGVRIRDVKSRTQIIKKRGEEEKYKCKSLDSDNNQRPIGPLCYCLKAQ